MASFPIVDQILRDTLRSASVPIDRLQRIFDFGAGLGRSLFVMNDWEIPGAELHAAEVNSRAATWLKDNVDFARIVQNEIVPPLPYEDNFFDLALGISVFTHLRLDLQFAWAWEMFRVLKPGGALLFSTHGAALFAPFLSTYLQQAHAQSVQPLHLGGDALMLDMRFGGALDADVQGQREVAIAHTHSAVRTIFDGFRVEYFEPVSFLAGHALYVLRKPHTPGRIAFPALCDASTPQRFRISSFDTWTPEIKYSLSLNGQREFRVFFHLERDFAGMERFNATPEIKLVAVSDSGEAILKSIERPLRMMFGSESYVPLSLTLNGYVGQLEISFSMRLLGTTPFEPVDLALNFPHAI